MSIGIGPGKPDFWRPDASPSGKNSKGTLYKFHTIHHNIKVPNEFGGVARCGKAARAPPDYQSADENDRIINLRDLGHVMRGLSEGRGSQQRVLIVLSKISGAISQRDLTERLGIQPGSASEVIAKLEAAGAVRRSPGAADRRTMDVELTEVGRQMAAEARARRHEEMFLCLSDGEKAQLLALLEKLSADWAERYGGEGEHPRHGRGERCGRRGG